MDSERWKQVDSLLQAVLEHPPAERSAFLRAACAGDEAMEAEVRSLLASQQQAGSFLESPAMELAARAIAERQNHASQGPAASLAGQSISHYQVVEKLGAGGMGVVWKARDTHLDRFVALKVLPAAKVSDPDRKRRFIQEARAASALNHPNIITIYEIGQAGVGPGDAPHPVDFIAMEFVPGKALNRAIPRTGLRLDEALHYAVQVADALAAAHAAGIVHRDLKPGNVMVSEEGRVKLLDFGLAKLTEPGGTGEFARADTESALPGTNEGVIVGTASYMSPEQAAGKKVDGRTDIFSFGALLYETIAGRRAFAGDSVASVLSAVLRDEPKLPVEIARNLPRGLTRILARCLEKDPNRRYQHAGDLKIDLQQVKEELAAGGAAVREEPSGKRGMRRRWWIAACTACAAVSFAAGWRLQRPETAMPPWKLTRLTADAGLSGSAALSPDGKLIAYSSDRGLDGEQDLYVKQVAGGPPIRLTYDAAGNTTPDFSPDGTRIVFRSNRGGGGIYEIPAFGGEARLVARDGFSPKYSPDGSLVAYWVGAPSVAVAVPGSGTLWIAPAAGGQPQRAGPSLTSARSPVWSRDGKHLLCIGYTSAKAFDSSRLDWWLVSTSGNEAVKTGAYDELIRANLRAREPANSNGPAPACWSAANTVTFATSAGNAQNLWEIGISPRTGKVSGGIRRLTTGSGNEVNPSCSSGGAVAFTNVETRSGVWSLPFDLDHGTARGSLDRITQGPASRMDASLSRNGRHLVFASNQSGQSSISVRDLAAGKESNVASSTFAQRFPVIDASGTRVAYSAYENDKRVVYVAEPGSAPEKLCEGCLRATDWSNDARTLLMFGGNPYRIDLLDLASHRETPLLTHPAYHLLYGRFSPDNRWVSFTARIQPNRGRIAIAPIDGPKPVPESAWITIAEADAADWANWSPDGKTLYFTSGRDGYACVWGQRIEAVSHRPAGPAFAVQHFHGRLSYQHIGWSAAGRRIAMVLTESTGNIWMMSRTGAR